MMVSLMALMLRIEFEFDLQIGWLKTCWSELGRVLVGPGFGDQVIRIGVEVSEVECVWPPARAFVVGR